MADIATLGVKIVGTGIDKTRKELDSLSKAAKKTEKETSVLTKTSGGMNKSFSAIPYATKTATSSILGLGVAVGGLAFATASMGAIQFANDMTIMSNKLKLVTDSDKELQQSLQTTYQISQNSRAGWESTVELYSRLSRSTKELGVSQERVATVTETITKLVQSSGASMQEASAGIIQLSQGFASGRLQGDELRSVMENLPAVARVLAESMGVTIGELRKMGAEGELTGDKLFKAFERGADGADAALSKTTITIEQATSKWGNLLKNTFSGVGQGINDMIAGELDKSATRWENNIGLAKKLGVEFSWGDIFNKSAEELVAIIHNTSEISSINNQINYLIKERNSSLYSDEKAQVQAQIDKLKEQKTLIEDTNRIKALATSREVSTVGIPKLDDKSLTKVTDAIAKLTLSANDYKRVQFDKEFEKLRKKAGGITPELEAYKKAFDASFTDKSKISAISTEIELMRSKINLSEQDFEKFQVDQWAKNAATAIGGYSESLRTLVELKKQDIDATYSQKAAEEAKREREKAESEKERAIKDANQALLGSDMATALQQEAIVNAMYQSRIDSAKEYGLSVVGIEAEKALKIQAIWQKEDEKHGTMMEGFQSGLQSYAEEAQSAYQKAQTVGLTMARTLESGIGQMLDVTGKGFEDFGTTATNVINDILNALVKASITEPLTQGIMSGIGSMTSGGGLLSMFGFHSGGIAGGSPTFTREAPVSVFANAPKYHTGGVIGSNEVPAILQKGEGVFTAEQMSRLSPTGSGSGSVSVVINNMGEPTSAETSIESDNRGGTILKMILTPLKQAIASDIATSGTQLNRASKMAVGVNNGGSPGMSKGF